MIIFSLAGERIEVATTRPETMLGDVALAVNPDDPRHAGLIGRRAKHPYLNRLMPIIADGSVDPDFGTGLSSEDQFK